MGIDCLLYTSPHGPETCGLCELQPGHTGPGSGAADEERLQGGVQHAGGYVPPQ